MTKDEYNDYLDQIGFPDKITLNLDELIEVTHTFKKAYDNCDLKAEDLDLTSPEVAKLSKHFVFRKES